VLQPVLLEDEFNKTLNDGAGSCDTNISRDALASGFVRTGG